MPKLTTVLAAALSLGLGAAPAVASEPVACTDPGITVDAPSPEEAALTCRLAEEAKARISACGLRQARPIGIVLVDEIEHAAPNCLATYDCTDDTIRVTRPEALDRTLDADHPYRVLPAEVTFQALLTHEMAHAMLEQSAGGREVTLTDHEYVAAAMELEALDPAWREALIAAAPVSLPPKPGLISALIYGFEPRKFATNAWQFFHAEPDGCARIREIAEGTYTFPDHLN